MNPDDPRVTAVPRLGDEWEALTKHKTRWLVTNIDLAGDSVRLVKTTHLRGKKRVPSEHHWQKLEEYPLPFTYRLVTCGMQRLRELRCTNRLTNEDGKDYCGGHPGW